jgi:hypothetical protein
MRLDRVAEPPEDLDIVRAFVLNSYPTIRTKGKVIAARRRTTAEDIGTC